jgi:PAS domain S-box-containing protein
MDAVGETEWLTGGGELGALVRSTDWSASRLGPRGSWPQVLRTLADIVLHSPLPSALLWGSDWVLLYNDAYRPFVGAEHPRALGHAMRDAWPMLWQLESGVYAAVMDRGETLSTPGASTQGTFVLCHSPIRVEGGAIAGALVTLQRTIPETAEATAAEKALRERKALLRAISDESSDAIFAKDREGRIRYANPTTLAVIGKPLDDVLGKTDAELLDDAGAARAVMETDRRVMASGLAVEVEEVVAGADGARRVWHSRKAPYRNAEGAVVGLFGISRDITDRKHAEEEEQRAKARLQMTLDSITEGVVVLDKDWRYTYFSETAAKLVGASGERFVGLCIWDRFPATRGSMLYDEFHRAVATGQPVTFEEYYPTPIDKWLECHCYPTPEGLSVYFHDVSERRRRERELRESNERLVLLARATSVFMETKLDVRALLERVVGELVPTHTEMAVVLLLSRDRSGLEVGAVKHADPEAQRRLGVALESHALPRHYGLSAEEVARGEALRIERMEPGALERTAGREALAFLDHHPIGSLLAIPLRTSRVLGALRLGRPPEAPAFSATDQALFQDIADRAALALEAALRFSEAEEAIHLRDDFLSIASHELRTPLTALLLQLQSMRYALDKEEQPATESTKFSRKLESSTRQTERLVSLVDDLLDVSRLSLGRLQLHREELDLAEVAREIVERHASQASAAGCPLRLAADSVRGAWDRLRIEQVLTNLIANAIKYGSGKPIDVVVSGLEPFARLSVRDRGVGIQPADLDRIFGRFERAVSGRHYGGLGLGLFISKQIVEAHGGTIRAESEPGDGSVFHVRLPMALGTATKDPVTSEPYA